jgi:hypothetical protein
MENQNNLKQNIITNEITHNDSGIQLNQNLQPNLQNLNTKPGYPNLEQGYNPNIQPGYNPNMQPGYNPNMQPGYNPNMQTGYNPNMQPGYNPNMQPNCNPNMQPGYSPNMQPGYNPNMQPGYNPNMQPGGINFYGNFVANFEQDSYLTALSKSNYAFIKQKMEFLEMITGCETKNRYNVFIRNPDGSYVYLFKAKEDSGFCVRQCCSSDRRPFSMKLKWMKYGNETDDFSKPLLSFEKPFKCTCCCFNRPEMTGINHEDGSRFGKIIDDWRCCNPSLEVFTETNLKKYKISGECCQCGLMCAFCADVTFYIYDAHCKEEIPSNALGSIVRKRKDPLKAILSDADNFDIYFPENANAYEKLMIIGATLMLDYTYFEEDEDMDRRKKNRYY